MREGTVTGWNLFRGFGFIGPKDPSEPPIHVHFSVLDGFEEPLAYLAHGETVLYEAEPGQPGRDGQPRQKAMCVRPLPGRIHGRVLDYDFQRGYGTIESDDGVRYFLHQRNMFGQGMKDADPGDQITFVPGPARTLESDPHALQVKLGDPRKPLYRYAVFPLEAADWLNPLKAKAATEVWDYQYERAGEGGHLPILRHYIEQTFDYLQREASRGRPTLVETERADGERLAIFNTGLVTDEEDAIYCLLVENRQPERAPWFFRGFYAEPERELSDVSVALPEAPCYLREPDRLIIEPEEIQGIRVDFRHIVVEHLDRFPEILQRDSNLADAALRGDIARLPDRIRRNYKAAVPQLYRDEIQMLLPLDLVAPKGTPDLALVVERSESGCRANTVLGVDAAYRQARLIARPDPEWLGHAWLATLLANTELEAAG